MVFSMLMAAEESPDPTAFRKSELYQRCVAAGVIPATEADLAQMAAAGPAKAQEPHAFRKELPDKETLLLQFKVAGMWCPACAWVIEDALDRRPGVYEAVCDFATDRLRCRYDPAQTDPEAVTAVVRRLGYSPDSDDGDAQSIRQRREFIRLILCALLSVNVMMLSWALYAGFFTSLNHDDVRYLSWPILVMTTVIMIYGGSGLFRKAWSGLRAAAPGMEVLVCLGSGSAYLYSLVNFTMGSWHLYFDTAGMLITLVLLGKMLESRAKSRVRRDLEGFLRLQPNKVRLCTPAFPQGRFTDIAQLAPGETFRVQAEEIVPADGRIVSGKGVVDESAITGESRPRNLSSGENITSGTFLLKGDVTVLAQRVGNDAMIGQMITVITSGLTQRIPLASRTDRWLAFFVPLMVGLAGGTFVIGHGLGLPWNTAFIRGLTVLVIACPCALGIAIPLARIAGLSGAGRKGLLVRDYEAFERCSNADTVVFDKTGTLTRGCWTLERIELRSKMNENEIIALAAGLEKDVDHAIARAVQIFALDHHIFAVQVDAVDAQVNGIKGYFQGNEVRIGNQAFVCPSDSRSARSGDNSSLSPVFLSLDAQVCAVLWFGDRIRSDAGQLVQRLSDSGFKLHMISGDAHITTAAVARELGIPDARGGLLPQDKAEFITRQQQAGHRVIMVGDGLNDAPALACAHLSVALHRDTALAQQAAHLTLMRGRPGQLYEFIKFAGRINMKVYQNLACAWCYNLLSIPIAMTGWLNPLVAATAMLLSSMTVIGNTLLLECSKKRIQRTIC